MSKERYDFYMDTLKMLPFNLEEVSDSDISIFLEELESDYVCFIHINTASFLLVNKLINKIQYQDTLKLRKLIDAIPNHLWEVEAFKKDLLWHNARKLATKILDDKAS